MNPRRSKDATKYVNVKISEEAQIAAKALQNNYMPGIEMQEVYSIAMLEYLHAYHPELEEEVATTLERRRIARRELEERKGGTEAP